MHLESWANEDLFDEGEGQWSDGLDMADSDSSALDALLDAALFSADRDADSLDGLDGADDAFDDVAALDDLADEDALADLDEDGSNAAAARPQPRRFFKDSDRLRAVPLAPRTPLRPAQNLSAMGRALAGTYNRLGGLMQALATQTGIPLAGVLAVWQVESAGRAHVTGQAIIRFENHLLFRQWGRRHAATYDRHFRHGGRLGVSGRVWEGHAFRESASAAFQPVHQNQGSEYRTLRLAMRLAGDDAALRSISIGGPQILIANHAQLGYPSARAMYDAFQEGERPHVLGFFDFCARDPACLAALRSRDFVAFARIYNGSGQAERYGGLIRTAYDAARSLQLAA